MGGLDSRGEILTGLDKELDRLGGLRDFISTVEANSYDIVQNILKKKEVLPVLLGIDEELDKMIDAVMSKGTIDDTNL